MTEKGADATMDVDQADSGVHKGSPSNFASFNQALTSQRIESKMDEMLKELKSVKTQFGDQQKVLETLQDQLQGLKPQKTPIEESTSQMSDEGDEKKQEKVDSLVSKQFVLKHIFKNISSPEVRNIKSETEEHFGVKWYIVVSRINGDLACYLHCRGHEAEKDWKIETEFEIKTYGSNNNVYSEEVTFCYSGAGGYGFPDFLERDEIEKNYSIDNGLKVEIHVKIKSTTGIYKDNQRKFDESMQDVSDITLINRCLTHIKTADDIRSIMPSDPRDLEPSLATILLQKSLSFQ
ncbi:hypothetical protein CAEBREN_18070 [Caenorhabditis brenneri]|uniref:MATH domain-containing protein n=1 Tax=Caenorhabditis brenneri TaxID=135651 RepID=G0MD92_CAEBE|nr:hypothetical protein CAEBREN_18070 [Caenorhabditis brenneri]